MLAGLCVCLGAGLALTWLAAGQGGPQGKTQPAGSATGVTADTVGSVAPEDPPKGLQAVPPPAGQSVKIQGVEGRPGLAPPPENTVRSVTDAHGSVQSIPGIEGIDTITLENLEAVLRIQQRATEPRPQGGARTAAALLTTDQPPQQPEETADAREEHLELEMEGS
jgi:hypothetical protein